MDDLFTIYRYLTNSRHQTDQQNPYNVAQDILDDYLDIERGIVYYAERIRKTGGLDWDETKKMTERVLAGFETALIHAAGSDTLQATKRFARKYAASSVKEIEALISFCEKEKAMLQAEKREESEASED